MGKCISKENPNGFQTKRTLTKDSDIDEKSSEFRDNFKVATLIMKNSDKKLIKSSLKKHFLFKQLSAQDLTIIYDKMKLCMLLTDEVVYDQDSVGSKFFIVRKGTLEIIKGGVSIGKLSKGETFGEMALLSQSKRKETVQTITNVTL